MLTRKGASSREKKTTYGFPRQTAMLLAAQKQTGLVYGQGRKSNAYKQNKIMELQTRTWSIDTTQAKCFGRVEVIRYH
jgi:hypothetical protein